MSKHVLEIGDGEKEINWPKENKRTQTSDLPQPVSLQDKNYFVEEP